MINDMDTAGDRLALLDRLHRTERRALTSQLASTFGHWMGTPLHVIAGRAALIRATSKGEAEIENARRIEEQVERLAARIRRFLEQLSFPELEPEWGEVSGVVESAFALSGPIAAAKQLELVLVTPDVPAATLERASALVVLRNLLSLAAHLSPQGSRLEVHVTLGPDAMLRFELAIPGFAPPRSRIDRLEPRDDEFDPILLDQLQVLSMCHAVARKQGARLELRPDRICFDCPTH